MPYILVFTVISQLQVAVSTAEFSSREACESASSIQSVYFAIKASKVEVKGICYPKELSQAEKDGWNAKHPQ